MRRVYSTPESRANHPHVWEEWLRLVRENNAQLLHDGENCSDYPDKAVAFETLNYGVIYSVPDSDGIRKLIIKY